MIRPSLLFLVTCLSLGIGVCPVFALSCDQPAVASGKAQTLLAELYTSEGCDSCPPADKWLSGISNSGHGIIPIAFHVDYWDYIGWKDRFAKSAFSSRQRESVARSGKRSVYTPQLLLNGRDVGYWHDAKRIEAARGEANVTPAGTEMNLRVSYREASVAGASPGEIVLEVGVIIDRSVDRPESALFLAVTENKLASSVSAGENRGASLRHDHVVRELIGPISLRADGKNTILRRISVSHEWKLADLNVVAFVQHAQHGRVSQAITSPVCAAHAG